MIGASRRLVRGRLGRGVLPGDAVRVWLVGGLGLVARRLILRGILVGRGGLGFLDRLDDLDDANARLDRLRGRSAIVPDLGPVGQAVAGAEAERRQVERLGVLKGARWLSPLGQIALGDHVLLRPLDDEAHRVEAEVVGGREGQADPSVGRHLGPFLRRGREADLGAAVGKGLDVVDHRLRVELALGRLELDRVRPVPLQLEAAGQLLRVARRGHEAGRPHLVQVEVASPCRQVGPGSDRDDRSFQGANVPPLDARSPGDSGVVGEVQIVSDRHHPGRRHHGQAVVLRPVVVRRQVVDQFLLDVLQRNGPRVVAPLALVERGGIEVVAAVGAVVQADLVGAEPPRVHLGREEHVGPRNHASALGVVAGEDVHQPRIRRPGDVGQQGPPGRIEHVLRGEDDVQAEQHDDGRQRVERPGQLPLVDGRLHLHRGQVLHRPRLQGPQHRRGELLAPAAEVDVIQQAILEARVERLDLPRRVEVVDRGQ
ncbi:hypothetical protein TsocGM_08485 [Tautonia sociabilis]|uniref:Uncharacterized protein n=1 Tax=Tautonia sociabilis TaxID=2080755 RepID=A0A432ML62_9BACT|nr:hypothetical protein TsocGM_08485 [Tautonia sociabilis]